MFRWKGSDALLARPCSKGRASERRRTGRERRRKLTETWRVPRVRHDIELELVNHRVHLEVLDCRLVAARARPGLNEPPVRTVRDVIEVDNVLPVLLVENEPRLGRVLVLGPGVGESAAQEEHGGRHAEGEGEGAFDISSHLDPRSWVSSAFRPKTRALASSRLLPGRPMPSHWDMEQHSVFVKEKNLEGRQIREVGHALERIGGTRWSDDLCISGRQGRRRPTDLDDASGAGFDSQSQQKPREHALVLVSRILRWDLVWDQSMARAARSSQRIPSWGRLQE